MQPPRTALTWNQELGSNLRGSRRELGCFPSHSLVLIGLISFPVNGIYCSILFHITLSSKGLMVTQGFKKAKENGTH